MNEVIKQRAKQRRNSMAYLKLSVLKNHLTVIRGFGDVVY